MDGATFQALRGYRLDPPDEPQGVGCDEDGPWLGPIRLLERTPDGLEPRPAAEINVLMSATFGEALDCSHLLPGLSSIARALSQGDLSHAMIATQFLRLPVLTEIQVRRARRAERLLKAGYNAAEPRDERGQWTDGDGQIAHVRNPRPGLNPASATVDETRARKERFVDAHLADAQKAADRLHVPVENILGASAIESIWGTSRFAVEGNNYFGLHYPAPFATGYIAAKDNGTKVATFASYADSLRSFEEKSGPSVYGVVDPVEFATVLHEK